jgi:hypothetical protein
MILYGLNTNYNQTVFEYQRQKPPNRRKNLIIAHVSLKIIIVALNTITHNPIAEILLKMIMDKNYVTLPTRPSALKIGLVISLKTN